MKLSVIYEIKIKEIDVPYSDDDSIQEYLTDYFTDYLTNDAIKNKEVTIDVDYWGCENA